MDMNNINGVLTPPPSFAKAKTETASPPLTRPKVPVETKAYIEPPKSTAQQAQAAQPKQISSPELTQAREEMVRRAAESLKTKTFFPINATRFTIFKDASGQFITRFTNLESGAVTHIPEYDMMDYMAKMEGGSLPATISTQA